MTDDFLGKQLGNYHIISRLGKGGMAQVYKAEDTTLKRIVAIKVIEPGLSADERYIDRFEREARAVAALEHPNIIPVYYFGQRNGLYYLAMKFIEGEDLGKLMHRYAAAGEYLPFSEILRIVGDIASAVDHAHASGVIHRDMKPSNIMVDRDGKPYLTDFGLVLNLSQGTVGEVFGTPHYIAPEQARNSAAAVPQSDLYSLGIVLYELFTGVVPFDDPSPTAIALQHMMNEPPAPRSLNPDLSPEIEQVILKAIAKKPEDRYQTGSELVEALAEAVNLPPDARTNQEFAALPPLPPGMTAPPPRRESMRPIANEVRASLTQRPVDLPTSAPSSAYAPTIDDAAAPPPSTRAGRPGEYAVPPAASGGRGYLPYIVGAVLLVLVIGGALVVLLGGDGNGNGEDEIAALATSTAQAAAVIPTETAVPVAEASATPSETETATVTPILTETPSPTLTPTNTSQPQPTTTEIPSLTPVPTVAAVVSGPTAAPAGWLPTRMIWTDDAFYWLNDAGQTIRVNHAVMEKVDGSASFAGTQFAFYSMESGRCVEIVFADVARSGCPENRRANAFFTPTRNQGVDFWTGSGQFRVLWDGVPIAVCAIADRACSVAVPPH